MTTYNGSCHCGAVQFAVETDLSSAISCNCSHCKMKGFILTFVPAAQFTLKSDEDNLQDYVFNTKKIRHTFCKTCGVEAYAYGKDESGNATVAVNLRCLDDVDVDTLEVVSYNGKDM